MNFVLLFYLFIFYFILFILLQILCSMQDTTEMQYDIFKFEYLTGVSSFNEGHQIALLNQLKRIIRIGE